MSIPPPSLLLHRNVSRVARACLLAVALGVSLLAAAQTTYESSKHGDPVSGVLRLPDEGPGACSQCHDEHASRGGVPNGGPFNRVLFTVDDETLCYECHSVESASNVYPGNVVWADSSHSMSPAAWWRGPIPSARSASDAGKCVNCHDPHGARDAGGVIPGMTRLREETLCTGCHNGIAATDIAGQIARAWRHPVERSGRHSAAEGASSSPAQFDDSGTEPRRHAECADCHNAHVSRADGVAPIAPEASRRLHGVARVAVTNRAAGTRPVYEWKGAADLIDPREYEICFKCHSSWTTLPLGKPDLAVLTNPNNPSYHPIQAAGKNSGIDAAAFETGWTWDSKVHCSDCHGSDDPQVRGPHGSNHRFILRAPSVTTSAIQPMSPTDLCFSCHRYDVYGDPLASGATQQASRFNGPAQRGHAYHVGAQSIPCYTCHATHGSTTEPSLIATGQQTPGIVIYSQNAGGGTCTPTCHAGRSWAVNYAR